MVLDRDFVQIRTLSIVFWNVLFFIAQHLQVNVDHQTTAVFYGFLTTGNLTRGKKTCEGAASSRTNSMTILFKYKS